MSRGLISSSVMFIFFQILTANLDLINKILVQQFSILIICLTINILMNKGTLLPSKPEEKQELIRKLKEEIARICPDASKATGQVVQKNAILEQRIKLIKNCQEYSESRLSNLQKIFKHYSTHLFRSGQKYDFDQIGYLNEHLIMQRFFAFINDFKLNEITYNGEPCQLAERNDIILTFKKSSSNARNLDLPQFIACLERLFVLLFDANQGYKDKQERLKKEKQQRAQEAKKRQKIKEQRAKLKAKMIANNMISILPSMHSAKAENPQLKPKQNDPTMKEMMKDFEIVNPNDEANKTVNEIKIEVPPENLYLITDSQKIESYFQRIGMEDRKQIDKKLRYFQKANYKYFEVEQLQKYRSSDPKKRDQQKGNQPLNPKRQLTEMHDEWKKQKLQFQKSNANRFIKVADKLSERQLNKSKLHMSRSLSRQEYDNKKKNLDDKFTKRQLALMYPTVKERTSKRKQQEQSTMYYNLQMLHKSSPNQLPINKINADRYVSADPTDSIYLQEYSFPRNVGGRAFSSFSNEKSQIVQSTKRRAHEIQNQESKRMNRLTVNLHQNQHYLQKFLERKW